LDDGGKVYAPAEFARFYTKDRRRWRLSSSTPHPLWRCCLLPSLDLTEALHAPVEAFARKNPVLMIFEQFRAEDIFGNRALEISPHIHVHRQQPLQVNG
jgi:hypothetical protein